MRYILLLIIKFYWGFIPVNKRRRCIFKESCSNFVYRVTKENGFVAGFYALKQRLRQCKPGYKIEVINNSIRLHLVDGTILLDNAISENITCQIRKNIDNVLLKI